MIGSRFQSSRGRNVVLALSVAALLHFGFSSLLWAGWAYGGIRTGDWPLRPVLVGSLPAVSLFAWFCVSTLMALWRRRVAAWLLGVGLLAGACVFAYDAATENYQLRAESYSRGVTEHLYTTWWWYNDTWFR